MIHVLSKILGRKKSGGSDSTSNGPATPCSKNQTIWQKATSLRQSLRHSSRSKVGQKGGFEFSNVSPAEKSATLGAPGSSEKLQDSQIRREWKSQRNLARERRSLATSKPSTTDEETLAKRSLHSRSLCMTGDWDVDSGVAAATPQRDHSPGPPPPPPPPLGIKQPRSPRKLTKDSGYETSNQCDPEYANSISDWFSQEKALDKIDDERAWNKDSNVRNQKSGPSNDNRLEWNTRNRPLSFSHQEFVSERLRNRQLRHSYSQREVSRHSREESVDSLADSSADIKKQLSVESVNNWPNCPAITKSTPHLAQGRSQRLSTSSTGSLLQSEPDEAASGNMVTRRFKKGSVYDTLASTSGLDFSPVVQLKTYNRRDDSVPSQVCKPSDKLWEKASKISRNSPTKDNAVFYKEKPKQETVDANSGSSNKLNSQESRNSFTASAQSDGNDSAKCIAAHEKYPSWPTPSSQPPSASQRSHSWTGPTDYPKEKVVYNRPKKGNQFKIASNQLQPVLERAPDYNTNKNSPENYCPRERKGGSESYNRQHPSSSTAECNTNEFDFDAFHAVPCIPQCYEEKEYKIHSPPERDISSSSSATGTNEESQSAESNGFINRYDHVLHHAQYSVPLSSGFSKQRNVDSKEMPAEHDTPFLDRLRLDNAWQMPPPPVPMIPAAAGQQPPPQPQQLPPQGNLYELSSETGTGMGSMESSSHGRGVPKWQGSYSDLSTLSTQLSNRSSLFDSGHSTMPESGRLSPQSSCDSSVPSLLLECPTRAQVVARHGCPREIIAHSARVQQPERHGSESILYYASGSSSRMNAESKVGAKKSEPVAANGNQKSAEEGMYRSHASVTLSPSHSKLNSHEVPDCQNKTNKCPSRQDSRKSSNSFSSEDSFPRSRSHCGDDTSGSSSDVSNITCISNYKGPAKSKSLKESPSGRDVAKHTGSGQSIPKYKNGYEQPKSMEEFPRKFSIPESDKRQRVSDPELKAIQKQAVMSFYQRMSLAESIKSEQKSGQQPPSDKDAPPPYEAAAHSRKNMYPPRLSLVPKKINNPWEARHSNQIPAQTQMPNFKPSDNGLLNHSKSVPNLVALKGQNLEVPPSQPVYKRSYTGSPWPKGNDSINQQAQKKRGSPLVKDEVISWDQLPNVLEKRKEAAKKEKALTKESKDSPEDKGGSSSGMHYFKSHKSPRKVQLKEVHHSNETASVKVMTPDGVTLVQTHEQRRDDKMEKAPPPPPHKRRPAPPPPPKQPPKRPPPPPPPVTPPPEVVVVVSGKELENAENKGTDHTVDVKVGASNQLSSSASSPQLGGVAQPPIASALSGRSGPPINDLPLPPPPKSQGTEIMPTNDEPLPPPPENSDVNVQPRTIDSSSLIYPKNSYMSYRSERKIGRQGFDGKYRRSFSTSASSVDLTTLESSFPDGKDGYSPNTWEQRHNIRQRGTTVIFHSNCMQVESQLQKSSSQECVLVEEAALDKSDNISTNQPQDSENNQSSTSINIECSNNQGSPQEPVPFIPASHEKSASEIQDQSPESHQNDNTKVTSSLNSNDMVMNNDSVNENSSPLDNNRILTDGSVDGESDTSNLTNVDLNQNAVKNNQSDENNCKVMNGSDQNRINSGTQTNETPKPRRKQSKTKEEVECEQLSIDFINHSGDTALKNLLVPSDNYKTISDYMDGLLNLELETGGYPIRKKIAQNNVSNNENKQKDEKQINNERSNSLVKMKTNQNSEVNENECTEEEIELKKRKEELIQCIEKKVDTLKTEQGNIKAEMAQNNLLGQEIAARLQKLAKPNELEKYSLHVEEMEKIVNLLLSLSGRLARAENILKSMPKDSTTDDKKSLEAKREKLREQHEDARRLKENIDRRSNQVSTFLHKYLTDDEYADYDRFIKLKTKLLMDIKELDEKINLGEEQLAALSVVAHLWKSANS